MTSKLLHLRNGRIFAIEISPRNEQAIMEEDWKEITALQAHSKLAHVNISQTIERAKKYRWKIKGLNESFTCEGCHIETTKKLAVNKE
jgi:hypothetical protein